MTRNIDRIDQKFAIINVPWDIADKIEDVLGFKIENCSGCGQFWPANQVDNVPLPYCTPGSCLAHGDCTHDRCKECQEYGDAHDS